MNRRRAKPSGIHLTETDAAQVKGMLVRGDRQHDIASWFGVNGGRIAEIAAGITYGWVASAAPDELPAPGPYLSGKAANAAMTALAEARAALAAAERQIRTRTG
ncbi:MULTISPECIES: hypothetical protein [unclassified Bosea (in: a-proteobacteria)]|uniref:hypothetical protein n=1 Tax=unclassified Bosea (in: a-proteobacteria) TaxID=2653178 RepID=UPI000F7620A4|nr:MULTISPECIES: hypothetical protein [unclassified Bosea (in: a-proteobacteria)]AZO76347.1 hypothetical protein BLM15_01090 [Bosea sp. Tri-49]RXT26275.1 hypothetical protein B5U98_07000 [Bosea sp. Tri-39]RXT31516.1 hypothetical protein B5U99_22545 [Bosea sp. Tri-54]